MSLEASVYIKSMLLGTINPKSDVEFIIAACFLLIGIFWLVIHKPISLMLTSELIAKQLGVRTKILVLNCLFVLAYL